MQQEQIEQVLENIAEQLDLDHTRHKNIEDKYDSICNWLNADSSPLKKYLPLLYSQGSVALGTEVKPVGSDEYDVDMVCELSRSTDGLEPAQVKSLIGDRFKQHAGYADRLVEKNRCWRIVYAGDFHLDIIPAIPDHQRGTSAILVPDRLLRDWSPSNPKGYAEWFHDRMRAEFDRRKAALAQKSQTRVEEIPDYTVKTPLQRTIQLLKRHRDIQFGSDQDKPISIIITTLAAHTYSNQERLYDALAIAVRNLDTFIEQTYEGYSIPNPVNNEENFADKWQTHPERERAFFRWLEDVRRHLRELEACQSLDELEVLLTDLFGERLATKSIDDVFHNPQAVNIGTIHPKSMFDVPHKKPLKWPYDQQHQVRVTATTREGIQRGVMPKPLQPNAAPIDKGYDIQYTATTNAPAPHHVEWQVVNTGSEAAAKNALRGDFYPSTGTKNGNSYRSESSLYTGVHWVEAFVIIDGKCVGRSGEFILNIK